MTFLHIIFLFLLISATSVSTGPAPEFQFPCYVDVCTFPRQYCNSDRNERRCSPCTRSLCKIDDLPRACLYYCQEADKPLVTTASPKAQTEIESKWQDKSDLYLVYLVIFIAVTNTILLLTALFISLWLLRFCAKKSNHQLNLTERFHNGMDEGKPLIETEQHHRQTKLEIKRLESDTASSQSLPPYTSNEGKCICISHDPSKDIAGTEHVMHGGRESPDYSERHSPVSSEGTRQSDSKRFVTTTFVSTPTNDEKHELHEKPWKLMESKEAFNTDLEETGLKQGVQQV